MAFKNANLTVINYANGWTMWHYRGEPKESIVDIRTNPKYFAPLWTLAACGDIMYITCAGHTEQVQIVKTDKDYVELR